MRIALVLNDNFTMWHFRRGLIQALLQRGASVYTVTPPGRYTRHIRELGAVHIAVPMERFIAPWKDVLTVVRLYRLFRREQFDLVHNMQIKPFIYGAIAARLARVRRVAGLIPGLGYPFFVENPGTAVRVLRRLVLCLLRLSCRLTDKVWFQNEDDMNFLVRGGAIPREKAVVIRGSGVSLEEFSEKGVDPAKVRRIREELNQNGSARLVLMVVARLIWSKGVREFVEAAAILGVTGAPARFLLVGPLEEKHPDAVPRRYLQERDLSNLQVLMGFREDVRELLWLSDVVVLPSYFREGVPRVLLEALAMGKPIVTTDRPGCREVVVDGENGYLVPAKAPEALAKAVGRLVCDEGLRERFGERSRYKAKMEFDEREVVRTILRDVYGLEN